MQKFNSTLILERISKEKCPKQGPHNKPVSGSSSPYRGPRLLRNGGAAGRTVWRRCCWRWRMPGRSPALGSCAGSPGGFHGGRIRWPGTGSLWGKGEILPSQWPSTAVKFLRCAMVLGTAYKTQYLKATCLAVPTLGTLATGGREVPCSCHA